MSQVHIPTLKIEMLGYKDKFDKPAKATAKVLANLNKELEKHFDLTPDAPFTQLVWFLFDQELDRRFAQIFTQGAGAKTIAYRKKHAGELVPVTVSGGRMPVRTDSRVGQRTGYLAGQLGYSPKERLGKIGGADNFGFDIVRGNASGSGTMAEFRVRLDAERFHKSYPRYFNEWVIKHTGLGLNCIRPCCTRNDIGQIECADDDSNTNDIKKRNI